LILPEQPQIAGALGAALFALDDYRKQGASRRAADSVVESQLADAELAMQACRPACAGKTIETQL
jgi:hypothetical protein